VNVKELVHSFMAAFNTAIEFLEVSVEFLEVSVGDGRDAVAPSALE
jgi:hypothetical protein